ncbi:MAG: peptidase M1 [Flammeovirgaceae bacterium]|nr:peptidase M1 [Flammeovirgaceae bacterium]MBR10487.1 peptidase M1 [Rickettsiales bacterium]|tara:strand:+ start:4643 stop:7198 length:2556 start_codon:yes stop_codon:yes gene_type:complete
MKILVWMLGITTLMMSCSKPTEDLLDVGIPLKMAEYRKQQVSDIQYQMSFDIPEKLEDPVVSSLELSLNLKDLTQPLYLDFNASASLLLALEVNGKTVSIKHQKEHLIVPTESLRIGENIINVDFHAGEQSLNRNEEFLYTLLVPDRASTLFPCFDQPNLKATYTLEITVPEGWVGLAGGPLIDTKGLNGKTIYSFEESDPMSTYLFSFVAGKFEMAVGTRNDRVMNMLYRETDSTKITLSIPKVMDHHGEALSFLEEYTNYPFPFQKLDFAAIPGFQYGGMEHVGAIQYRESSMFLDESATDSRKLGRAKLIAHETAHMWFGDLVTMDWFSDVWMKEVFANFMADKIVNPTFPEINHSLNFFTSHYASAYSEDRTQGSNPIRQPLDNLKNAGTLYGRIIYNKAPIMMRQLETLVGEEPFRDGIREYMKTYAYDNAVWNDLVTILDKRTEADLLKWSEVWVNQPGRPIIEASINYEEGAIKSFDLAQKAENGTDLIWPQVFTVDLIYSDEVKTIPVTLEEKSVIVEKAVGLKKPQAIIYNANGYGYGVFPVDESSLDLISSMKDEVARASAYTNIYENILSGNLDVTQGMDVYLKAITSEENELVLSLLTSKLRHLFWHFLSTGERSSYQPTLEKTLLEELNNNRPANQKKVLFGLFESIAYSDSGINTLYSLWNKSSSIEDLKLNQDDFTGLAMTLSLYRHPKSEEILKEAKEALTNSDKIKRFEFIEPALSTDKAVQNAFFTSLNDARNREKEAWVLTAIGFIHHPLNQENSIKHLKTSLDLLQEIQLTGDIFFPKRWLVATIGQYHSQKAYEILNTFHKENPEYNQVLKNKLMQASDDLIRFNTVINN